MTTGYLKLPLDDGDTRKWTDSIPISVIPGTWVQSIGELRVKPAQINVRIMGHSIIGL